MLTFRISPPQATHKETPLRGDSNRPLYLQRDYILKRQVSKCPFTIGDRVTIKGQPTGKNRGKVIDIVTDPKDVTWLKGGQQPAFIIVDIPMIGYVGGSPMQYGTNAVACPLKILRKA